MAVININCSAQYNNLTIPTHTSSLGTMLPLEPTWLCRLGLEAANMFVTLRFAGALCTVHCVGDTRVHWLLIYSMVEGGSANAPWFNRGIGSKPDK